MSFFNRLEQLAIAQNTLLCIGLDPHLGELPEQSADAAKKFCLNIIEETKGLVLAYKPNIAFFEVFGGAGIEALKQVIAAVPEDIPVILDAKRGDIASTADAYAQAAFIELKADAITLSPYLGQDSITPFIKDPDKGVFLLCKTSNPGAADLQDQLLVKGMSVYQQVASAAKEWNSAGNLGLVVGATHPDALGTVRQTAPDLWILAPGVGAQGGSLEQALKHGLRADGTGLIFPVSRGISQAKDRRQAAMELNEQINAVRSKSLAGNKQNAMEFSKLAEDLYQAGCVKFGEFTLKSGLKSPIYIDLRQLASHPQLLFQVASAYRSILENLTFDRLVAIPYAAMPICTATSLQGNWPMIYPRKEAKDYGTKAVIEGEHQRGEQVAVVDDLTTTGSSKFEVIEKLTAAGLQVKDIIVLIDRESGAAETLRKAGLQLHAVFTLSQLAKILLEKEFINPEQQIAVEKFINASNAG